MSVDFSSAKAVGLSEGEWASLLERLGREPSIEELQMIGVMWSEHCSYKSSKVFLKQLITEGQHVLQGPGENAGLVAFDSERAIAFKVESHNHPSFIEPFQGAATGVGGILRDIFTVGARPVALGNYLRFGSLGSKKHQHLVNGVVSGIAHYGNCVGIPTLGGQLHTHACYDSNILVNVFALGVLARDKVFLSNSAKPGQLVMVWGAKTGRDGIHGASLLASADFEEGGREVEQKIRVQVGDPFKEKCLMEATLECMETLGSEIGAIQDMGAAGLTCSTMEIADKSGVGMAIELDKVPVRESGMQAFELLLSESQERMLAVVTKGSEEKFEAVLRKWGCDSAVIGETTADGFLKFRYRGEQVVNLPVSSVMEPPAQEGISPSGHLEPECHLERSERSLPPDIEDEWGVLKLLLSRPRLASKSAVFQNYDSSVGGATVFGPGEAEAAVLALPSESEPYLGVAFKGACDEVYAQVDAAYAARYSMAECARALACVGAQPLAITDGMNFGNPNEPHVRRSIAETVRGINEGIQVFETPCISGNVSLFNQTQSSDGPRDIYPTTFIVMAGRVKDVRLSKPSGFQAAGNEVWLLQSGEMEKSFPYGSLYAREFASEFWRESRRLPHLDLVAEKNLQQALLDAHHLDLFESVRDVTDGGLAVSLVEACFSSKGTFGFDGDFSKYRTRRDVQLFDESGGRVVVEIPLKKRAELLKHGMKWKLECKRLGAVIEDPIFRIRPLMTGNLSELKESFKNVYREIL